MSGCIIKIHSDIADKEPKAADIVKGYQYEKDKYVITDNEEIDAFKGGKCDQNNHDSSVHKACRKSMISIMRKLLCRTESMRKKHMSCCVIWRSCLYRDSKTVIGNKGNTAGTVSRWGRHFSENAVLWGRDAEIQRLSHIPSWWKRKAIWQSSWFSVDDQALWSCVRLPWWVSGTIALGNWRENQWSAYTHASDRKQDTATCVDLMGGPAARPLKWSPREDAGAWSTDGFLLPEIASLDTQWAGAGRLDDEDTSMNGSWRCTLSIVSWQRQHRVIKFSNEAECKSFRVGHSCISR